MCLLMMRSKALKTLKKEMVLESKTLADGAAL
jgi:hypothetical protein